MRMPLAVGLFVLAVGQSAAQVPALSWVRTVPVPGFAFASASTIVVDAAGDIFAAGQAARTREFLEADIVVASLDRFGAVRWVRVHDGPDHGYDGPDSVSTDGGGNAYVTALENLTLAPRAVLLKYGADGTLLWERRYANGSEGATITRPAIDPAGNLYFVVLAEGVQSLISLDPAGTERFSRTLAPANLYTASAIAPDGTLVIAGGPSITRFVRFDLSGNQLMQGSGAQPATGFGSALAFGPDGEIFVATGEVLTKFDATGAEAWHYVVAGPSTHALAVDAAGQATFVWETFEHFVNTLEVTRFDRAGSVLWHDSYTTIPAGKASGREVVLGKAGSADVVGWELAPGAFQWFVVRYTADGRRVAFPGRVLPGQAAAAARMGDDGLVVAGYTGGEAVSEFALARYGTDGTPPGGDADVAPVPASSSWGILLLVLTLIGAAAVLPSVRRRP
jgi:outer membrane protein assembly factor BamB